MMHTAITSLLREHAGVPRNRVTPSTVTERVTDDYPRVLFTKLKRPNDRPRTDSGKTGLVFSKWQIDVFTEKAIEAEAIADAIIDGLDEYSGTVEGVEIVWIECTTSYFTKGTKEEGANTTPARYVIELLITYRE